MSEKTSLILHGHFYQPPRENPRTNIIDLQESAYPFPDWNEKIWASCYRSNAHSRYLDIDHIQSISNNYQYISFNFGPTLLSWMSERHPDTLEDIKRADRASVLRLGHGNAIAQAFNHTILPLDSRENAALEVDWALSTFERWFGRKSEGFWCPETAINPFVVDILSERGVQFVILSPWQCQYIENEKGELVDLKGKPAPYDRPFRLRGAKGGEINVFFYHPGLASGISFGHLLRDADGLYKTLLEIRKADGGPALIHTATDGEIYGHHEPYGDMALAALIRKVRRGDDFVLSNYGAFLERHPAKYHALLYAGEEGRGTSWSCSHGVSRWYKDCGCRTGGEPGWNQKWRTPLRRAFEHANRVITAGLQRKINTIFHSPLPLSEFLKPFGLVAAKQESMTEFLRETERKHPLREEERHQLAMVAECALNSLYSFTSCGWFFSDLGGLEPRQNIAYALRSIELFGKLTGEDLLPLLFNDLQYASCNRKQDGNGMTIAREEWSHAPGTLEASLFFLFQHAIGKTNENYGRFEPLEASEKLIRFRDRYTIETFRAEIRDLNEKEDFHSPLNLSVTIINEAEGNGKREYHATSGSIPLRMSRFLTDSLCGAYCDTFSLDDCRAIARQILLYRKVCRDENAKDSLEASEAESLGLAYTAIESILTHIELRDWKSVKEVFFILVSFVSQSRRDIDRLRLANLINDRMNAVCRDIISDNLVDDDFLLALKDFVHVVRKNGVKIDMTTLQETFYPFLTESATDAMKSLSLELNFSTTVERERE